MSHNPDIGLFAFCAAERFIGFILQHSKQTNLQGRRDVAYFIQKEGSAVCQGEPSWLVFEGSAVSPFYISEKLRFRRVYGSGPGT